jgi:hypothetical protein
MPGELFGRNHSLSLGLAALAEEYRKIKVRPVPG